MKPESNALERTVILTYGLTFILFSVWLGGIFLAPYLRSLSFSWAGLVYSIYSPFCHQLSDRSLSCFGHPLAVCSRCLGIYSGFALGLILYPFLRGWRQVRVPERRLFFLFSGPIVLDTGANLIKLWQSPNALRVVTGLLWGVLLPFYFVTGVVDSLKQRKKRRSERAKNSA